MHYYQLNIGDFLKATDGFSDAEVGVFVRLLNRYASTEKPIKTQWVKLAFKGESQEKALCILECSFEEVEDGWIYPEISDQVEKYVKNAEKNRENGKKGGRPRKDKSESVSLETQQKPIGLFVESETNPEESLTINQKTNNQEYISTSFTNVQEVDSAPLTKTSSVGRKALTSKFDLETLPDDWREYCIEVRPDLDPEKTFTCFKGFWTIGKGKGKLRSEKGWTQSWMTWVRNENEVKQTNNATPFRSARGPKEVEQDFNQLDYGQAGAF